jgi:hypothetical protein
MQDGKIAGKVVSNVALLLKSIRKTKSCCCNNQENYERESHTWGKVEFPYEINLNF